MVISLKTQMTKIHRKKGDLILGNFAGIDYSIEQTLVDEMKEIHGLDAVAEIEKMIREELINNPTLLKDQNES